AFFGSIGVYFFYLTLAAYFNRTTVELGRASLTVRNGPFPVAGDRTYETARIRRIYFDHEVRWWQGIQRHRFHVRLTDSTSEQLAVLENVRTPEAARYVAEQLQEWLERIIARSAVEVKASCSEAVWRSE